jgi:hypothetical protein
MAIELFDTRALHGILAAEPITRRQFAAICGLTVAFMRVALMGVRRPGEEARHAAAE